MEHEVGRIYTALLQFFDDWFFTQNDEEAFLRLSYSGKHGSWDIYAQARDEQGQFICYSVYPQMVPEQQRPAMAELLTRLNYGLILGNFEMDYADGEIRYKTSVDVEAGELTPELIKPVVYANLGTMDHYWPALAAVAEGRAEPQKAAILIGP